MYKETKQENKTVIMQQQCTCKAQLVGDFFNWKMKYTRNGLDWGFASEKNHSQTHHNWFSYWLFMLGFQGHNDDHEGNLGKNKEI